MKIHQNRTCFMLQNHRKACTPPQALLAPTRRVRKATAQRSLFDHPVGKGKQFIWHRKAERLGGLEVEHEVESGGAHDRSEVLQVISSSPGTLKPVFETILAKVTRIGSSLRRHSQTPMGTSHAGCGASTGAAIGVARRRGEPR